MPDVKEPTNYEDQIKILQKHGCHIEDEERCARQLSYIPYYRLTAYFLPFKTEDGTYQSGTTFEKVYRIYEFDRKLRNTLFSAIEEIEIYLRSQFSYFYAFKYGSLGYMDASNYNAKHDEEKFSKNLEREINSNSKVLFVRHHQEVYNGQFPIWVALELFSFGMLSCFYNDWIMADKKYISQMLYKTTPKNLSSWLRCCTDLRNICAHYGRLYYRIFSAVPAGINIREAQRRRLWGAVLTVRELYPFSDKWNKEIVPRLAALLEEYSQSIDLFHMAFPTDWEEQLMK